MKQLSGLDATFLHLETAEMPMHVGALNLFELPAGHRGSFVSALRRHMAERLPLVAVLRRRLWWMPLNLANPAWVDAEPDLRQHIVAVKLPKSARRGDGMPELEAAVAALHIQRLDRSRPLWKFFVLEGLAPSADGRARVGLYAQFHHAAVDGQAAVAMARVILDTQPEGRDIGLRPSTRGKVFRLGLGQMLRGAIVQEAQQVAGIIKGLPATVGALAGAAGQALANSGLLRGKAGTPGVKNLSLAPRTAFNQTISASRSFATVSLPLARLKALGKAHGATLNDIVLLLCATALRRYLSLHATVPRKSLVAAVPVSLRAGGDTTADTQATLSLISLGTHLADMGQRLAHIKAASVAMKATMGGLKSVMPTDYPSIGVPWLMEAAAALYGRAKVAERVPLLANLTISNVPGPPVALYLAGARMVHNFPTSILTHGLGLNITVESYDQQLDFGLVADGQACPKLRVLADAIQTAFEDLCLLEPALQLSATAAPGLAQAGKAAAGQAGRRLQQTLSRASQRVGSAVGGAVAGAVSGAVGVALGQAVKQAVKQTVKAPVKPGAKPARRQPGAAG